MWKRMIALLIRDVVTKIVDEKLTPKDPRDQAKETRKSVGKMINR